MPSAATHEKIGQLRHHYLGEMPFKSLLEPDALFRIGEMHDALDANARRVDVVRVDGAG